MRPDLLALTPDALAALTNRGLVRRATRSIEAGESPAIETDADGTVHAEFPDGTRTTMPLGGLDTARCTCGAVGHCRHTITLVLAYQATVAVPGADSPVSWSPGDFTDEQIEAVIGPRAIAAARRAARTGYVAQIHRPTATDAAPRVDLPSCTVRFLVPGDLDYVRSDAALGTADEAVALAVWAFRAADATEPAAQQVRVEVGIGTFGTRAALTSAAVLANDLLLEGAVHATGLLPAVTAVARALDAERLRWPLLAVDDIAEQLAAYAQRSARYRAETLAELLAEIHARHRATNSGTTRPSVLGIDEPSETRLRTSRLIGLGCRIRAAGTERSADIFLADSSSATVLVLRHRWTAADDESPARTAGRRVAGATIAALAAGNVVTESATRTASRRVRLPVGRVSRNSVTSSSGDWDNLPPGILVRDLTAFTAELDRLPPRLIRPRIDAEAVRVVPVARVQSMRYLPGDQRLDAMIADPSGSTATVSSSYSAASPGALDAIADALPEARYVSGVVRRGRGGLVITPLAVVTGQQTVIPDLAPARGIRTTDNGSTGHTDEIGLALDNALSLLAELAHRGARHLPPSYTDRLHTCAATLSTLGLERCGRALADLARARGADELLINAWIDAQIRLTVAADSR
jgi:hypothetical protein